MVTMASDLLVSAANEFQQQGFTVARSLFSGSETNALREHFMELRKSPRQDDYPPVDSDNPDPLRRWPRMIHMHRWDEVSMRWLTDARLNTWLTAILGKEPFAVQTMLYYKPAGARGQALHQDQFYLKVQPGTCVAAWMALDDCDEENGCLNVVPGSHTWPVLCPVKADSSQSFTDVTVPLKPGTPVEPVVMRAGDVLFFNGQLVHGSLPNVSTDRFRRALIGHYIVGEAESVAPYYHPVLRMDGTQISLAESAGGGPCGIWAEDDGEHSKFDLKGRLEDGFLHE